MPTGAAGGQMLLGISLHMNARGVVAGANAAETALGRVERRAASTQRNVGRAAAGMGNALQQAMGMGLAGAAALGIGQGIQSQFLEPQIEQAKSFQVEMSQLGFVTKATKGELDDLKGVAIKTGLETQFSPQEAARGLRVLRAAGLSTAEALESLRPALDVATGSAGMLGLDTAAQATAAALMKFKHNQESAVGIMDNFANATRETNLQFHDLPILLNSLRVAPALLKASSAEVLTLAGAMKNTGMSAAEAGMAVMGFADNLFINERMLQRYLARQKMTVDQFNKLDVSQITKGRGLMRVRALKDLGVEIFDAAGKMKSAQVIIRDLLANLERLSGESEKKYLMTVSTAFSRQAKNMLVSLKGMERNGKKGVAAFNELLGAIGSSAGAVRESAAAFEETNVGLEKFIEGTNETINILMGSTLLPILHSFHMGIRQVLNSFLTFVEKNPSFARALGILAIGLMFIAKAAGLALLGMAGFLTWSVYVQPMLISMGGAAGIAASGMNLLTASLAKTIAVMKPLLGLFLLMWIGAKIWEKIWDEKASGVWKSIQMWMRRIQVQWEAFQEGFMDGIGIVLQAGADLFTDIGNAISWVAVSITKLLKMTGLVDHVDNVKEMAAAWRIIGRVVGVLVAGRMLFFAATMVQSTIAALGLLRTVGTLAVTQLPALGGALSAVGSGMKLVAQGAWFLAANLMKGLWGAVQAVTWGVWHLAISVIPRVIIAMGSWVASLVAVIWKHTVLATKSLVVLMQRMTLFALSAVPKVIGALGAWFLAIGGVIAQHMLLAGKAIVAFIAAIPGLVSALAVITAAWWAKFVAMVAALSPYLLIGAAIALVVTALVILGIEIWKARHAIWDALVSSAYAVRDFFVGMWRSISNFFTGIVDRARNWGVGLWTAFKDGMTSAWGGIKGWFLSKIQWIRDLLPGSNAKRGPLSELTVAGQGLLTTVQAGAEERAPQFENSVANTLGRVRATLSGSQNKEGMLVSGGGSTKTVTIDLSGMVVNVANSDEAGAKEFVEKIVDQLRDYFDNENEVAFE